MAQDFIPGLELSKFLFTEAVQPLLSNQFPQLKYSAARLDRGSEVLGFDTPMSMDHGWGQKLTLFLNEEDYDANQSALVDFFSYHLPFTIHGFPTNFSGSMVDGGLMTLKEDYPITHCVSITTPERFFKSTFHLDINQPLTVKDWLIIPSQRLRTVRAGQIYYDGLGRLAKIRARFHWYPHDLWLYLLASQLAAYRSGCPLPGSHRLCWRRTWLAAFSRPVSHRPDEPGFPDGAGIRPYRKMVRHGFPAAFYSQRPDPHH